MADLNRQVLLTSRPSGIAQADNFAIRQAPVEPPAPGQILVRNHYLSIEPAMRGWIADAGNYAAPVAIGSVMRSLAVGEVVASAHPDYAVGEHVSGWFGWQDYACLAADQVVQRTTAPEMRASLGILGINGMTAYLALTLIGMRTRSSAGVAKLSAFAQCTGYLLSIPGPLLVGVLYQHSGGWGLPLALMTALMIPQIVVGFLAGRNRTVEEEAARLARH